MSEAIILGIIQGLTEFLPVSSSAHLVLIPWFFKWEGAVDTITFDVALHFGTLIALLIYFRDEWMGILRTIPGKDSLVWKLLIGTVPAGLVGLLFHDFFEAVRDPIIIVFTLCLVSILMIISERRYRRSQHAGIERLGLLDALFIGIAQAFALVPGVSRSGITIVAGLTRGLRRDASARFSFLLGTPAILGASMLEAKRLIGSGEVEYGIFITGVLVSAVTGYIAIRFLLGFFQRHTLIPFAYYRFFLASVIILSIWRGLAG
jgi:undecaprenyl-diphosphatase